MVFFTYHYYSSWGYILVSQKEKEALIKKKSQKAACSCGKVKVYMYVCVLLAKASFQGV